ncbi:hypothetical protein CYMTET_27199 [Cymbomonas tetramitiformis]|uniref:Uncharacterized protein n=1 Tax=Cymbomonas tetramitiformis TaxID=36881 RepID=A0AAE0KXG7_9CHLO|nr:hypothetical protein CYMTET_27199 [Cymbomonas tetramitiformis]
MLFQSGFPLSDHPRDGLEPRRALLENKQPEVPKEQLDLMHKMLNRGRRHFERQDHVDLYTVKRDRDLHWQRTHGSGLPTDEAGNLSEELKEATEEEAAETESEVQGTSEAVGESFSSQEGAGQPVDVAEAEDIVEAIPETAKAEEEGELKVEEADEEGEKTSESEVEEEAGRMSESEVEEEADSVQGGDAMHEELREGAIGEAVPDSEGGEAPNAGVASNVTDGADTAAVLFMEKNAVSEKDKQDAEVEAAKHRLHRTSHPRIRPKVGAGKSKLVGNAASNSTGLASESITSQTPHRSSAVAKTAVVSRTECESAPRAIESEDIRLEDLEHKNIIRLKAIELLRKGDDVLMEQARPVMLKAVYCIQG